MDQVTLDYIPKRHYPEPPMTVTPGNWEPRGIWLVCKGCGLINGRATKTVNKCSKTGCNNELVKMDFKMDRQPPEWEPSPQRHYPQTPVEVETDAAGGIWLVCQTCGLINGRPSRTPLTCGKRDCEETLVQKVFQTSKHPVGWYDWTK